MSEPLLCQVVHPRNSVKGWDMTSGAELCRLSLRRATLPALKDSGELRGPWLPSSAGERFGFRVSTCDEGISPTNAARFGPWLEAMSAAY